MTELSKIATVVLALGAAVVIGIGVSQMLEEDKKREKLALIRMKYKNRLKQLNAETSKLETITIQLEKDVDTASKQDEEKKKVSSYYFFSSSGSKNKNKWDNFKDEEENDVSKGENEAGVPTLTNTIRSLKEKTLACRELTNKIDQVAADMVAEKDQNETLVSIRKRLAKRIAKLEKRCEDSLKNAQNLLVEKNKKRVKEKNNNTVSIVSETKEMRKPLTEEEKAQLVTEKKGALSNWNKSGKTWEERDVTERATTILRRYLKDTSAVVNKSTIRVVSVDSLKGNASMLVHANKYIFEYSFVLSWSSDSDTKGTLRFAEIDVLQLKENEIEASGRSVDAGDRVTGLEHAKSLERAVVNSLGSFFEELIQESDK